MRCSTHRRSADLARCIRDHRFVGVMPIALHTSLAGSPSKSRSHTASPSDGGNKFKHRRSAASVSACSELLPPLPPARPNFPGHSAHLPASSKSPAESPCDFPAEASSIPPAFVARLLTARKWSAILWAAIPSSHVRSVESPENDDQPCSAASTVSCTTSSATSGVRTRPKTNRHSTSPCSSSQRPMGASGVFGSLESPRPSRSFAADPD